jgi:acetoacetyl-CoA synthetase
MSDRLWIPTPDQVDGSNLTGFMTGTPARDYAGLYRWSIEQPEEFWAAVWRFCGVVAEERPSKDPWDQILVGRERVAPPDPTRGPRWFVGARLNFAENLMRFQDARPALVFWNEQGRQSSARSGPRA